MFEAEVGDDVYGEDPTVNRLEQRAAEIFAREAAIFVPTGSMGNQIAIKIHTDRGRRSSVKNAGTSSTMKWLRLPASLDAWFVPSRRRAGYCNGTGKEENCR